MFRLAACGLIASVLCGCIVDTVSIYKIEGTLLDVDSPVRQQELQVILTLMSRTGSEVTEISTAWTDEDGGFVADDFDPLMGPPLPIASIQVCVAGSDRGCLLLQPDEIAELIEYRDGIVSIRLGVVRLPR